MSLEMEQVVTREQDIMIFADWFYEMTLRKLLGAEKEGWVHPFTHP